MIPKTDIVFDDYGDVQISNGDIKIISNRLLILRQHSIDRIKSSFGDYKLYKNLGADLNYYIGKPITNNIESQIEESIIRSLTIDGFLERRQIACVATLILNEVVIKTEIYSDASGTSLTSLTINGIFNTINGVVNVY